MGDYTEHLISMAGGDGETIADILTAHGIYGMSAGTHSACRCNREWVKHAEYRAHLEAELTAAGFGPAKEAGAKALEYAAEDFSVNLTVMSGPKIRDWMRASAAAVRGES